MPRAHSARTSTSRATPPAGGAFARSIGIPKELLGGSRSFGGIEADRQPRRAVYVQRFSRLPRFGALKPYIRGARQELGQRHARLQTRKWRTQAKVNPVAKRDVRIRLSRYMKPPRLRS